MRAASYNPQLAERQDALLRELKATQRRAAADGWYRSGRFLVTATRLGDAEIKIRLRLVAGLLFRVVTESGVPPDPELEQNLTHELSIHANEAKQSVTETIIGHLKHFDSRLVDGAKQFGVKITYQKTNQPFIGAGEFSVEDWGVFDRIKQSHWSSGKCL